MATVSKSYYAIRNGNKVIIRKTANPLKRVVETLVIPKLTNSPVYTPEGDRNRGTIINKFSYKGGIKVGEIPYGIFVSVMAKSINENGCMKIPTTHKGLLINLIDRYCGDN